MTLLVRVQREPAKLLAFVTAVLAVATLVGVLPVDLAGPVLAVVAAAVGLLSYVVTPASEVVVQQRPGDAAPVAGPAAAVSTGAPVTVALEVVTPPDPNPVDDITEES